MILISNRYCGSIARCPNCFAILGYTPDDVNSSQNIKCPQCNFMMWVPMNINYDGVIKDDKSIDTNNNNDNTNN